MRGPELIRLGGIARNKLDHPVGPSALERLARKGGRRILDVEGDDLGCKSATDACTLHFAPGQTHLSIGVRLDGVSPTKRRVASETSYLEHCILR